MSYTFFMTLWFREYKKVSIQPVFLLRDKSFNEEIDHNFIKFALNQYASPRNVLTGLLKKEQLIRVKKGLYTFGDRYRKRLISLEVLANLIYGPSYVSREYALQYHGMIPESVHEITSMSIKRHKQFDTPLGVFSYQPINKNVFSIGVNLVRFSHYHCALIASPEKALADYIYSREDKIMGIDELTKILLEDYRIDEEKLIQLDRELLSKIAIQYNHSNIKLLELAICELKYACLN